MTPLDTTPQSPTQPPRHATQQAPRYTDTRHAQNDTPPTNAHGTATLHTTQTMCSQPIPTALRHQTRPTEHAPTNPDGTATPATPHTHAPRKSQWHVASDTTRPPPNPTAQRHKTPPRRPQSHANPSGTVHRAHLPCPRAVRDRPMKVAANTSPPPRAETPSQEREPFATHSGETPLRLSCWFLVLEPFPSGLQQVLQSCQTRIKPVVKDIQSHGCSKCLCLLIER